MGLANITNFQMIWSNINLSRSWSHDALTQGSSNITSIVGTFTYNPVLHLRIATSRTPVPRSLNWDWLSINCQITNFPGALASGASTTLTTNSRVYPQIPRKFVIACPQQLVDRTFNSSSTFCGITNVMVNFADQQGQMQQAQQIDLYRASLANGYLGSYDDWTNQSGSVLILVPGRDFPLPFGLAPGSTGSYTINFQLTVTNLNPQSLTPVCYVINLDNGFINVTDGFWRQEIITLNPPEVKAAEQVKIPEDDVKGVYFLFV